MSKELENSLQRSIEAHFSERLETIDQELSRLQSEFGEALARLREAAGGGLETDAVANAIAAHLQAAREQKLTGASPASAPSADVSIISRAISEIQKQGSQVDILTAWLKHAVEFADRVAIFIVKHGQIIGWRGQGPGGNELSEVRGITFPVAGNSIINRAASSGAAETGPASNSDDAALVQQLGGEPQQLAAVPLIVRERTVAILYADSAWPHPDAIQVDALEALSQITAMAIELLTARATRSIGVATAPSATEPVAPQVSDTEAVSTPAAPAEVSDVTAEAVSAEPPSVPDVEAAPPETVEPPQAEASIEPAPQLHAEPVAEPAAQESTPAEASGQPSPPEFSPQYAAPLGAARRFGASDQDLPVEVSEDERRLHNDARRFARLLVSEIKLYNEQKVSEGRNQGDLYDRLREDIDRSRQMYDKRVAPPVAARHDYFHQELVSLLAEGDPSKLGNSYPGAAIAA